MLLFWPGLKQVSIYNTHNNRFLYRSDCGPSWCPVRCRPEVFAGEIQSCSTTVSSAGSPWGASNPSLRPERVGPQRSVAPRAASRSCPQKVSAQSGSRPAGYLRSRKRLQLPPERQQKPPPSCSSAAGKVQRGGPEAALLRTSPTACLLPGTRTHARPKTPNLRSRVRWLLTVLFVAVLMGLLSVVTPLLVRR